MENEVSKLRKSTGLVKWIAAAGVFALLAPPLAYAATQDVKVTNTPSVKVKDSAGGAVDSKKVPPMGLFDAQGSPGALAVRNFAGGGGFLGGGDCGVGPQAELQVIEPSAGGNTIVTGILVGPHAGFPASGNGVVQVSSDALGGVAQPVLTIPVNEEEIQFVGLGNGLTITDNLNFRGTNVTGEAGSGTCQYVILGQGPAEL